jgi:DNA-binding NarL/FixJ family response regulator
MKAWTALEGDVALIVDDVPENLALLSDALSEAGYSVLVATDGASALELLQRITPDIILLDAVMPGIDGFETCRRIKAMEDVRHVPVMFMTGLTETEHVVKGFESGGLDYVTKPIEPAEVLARVATHIRNARLLAQASHAIDAVSHAAVSLRADGMPLWQTKQAGDWLARYFPDDPPTTRELPAALRDWLRQALDTGGDAAPMMVGRDGMALHLSLSRRRHELLLLLEEKPIETTVTLDQYQLTPREIDVLRWVAKGKTNRDIGEILGMSPRTVNKHLEHIYVKLGVETRAAATAVVASKLAS